MSTKMFQRRARRAAASCRRLRGFTLIEVMITVAIVAILSAIALPSYRDYILRGRLVDATNLLATGRANMERYFQDNRTYATVGSIVPPCAVSPSPTQGPFTLTCGTPTNTAYTLTATGSGTTAGFTFTTSETDQRTTTIAAPAPWPAGPFPCWLVKRGTC